MSTPKMINGYQGQFAPAIALNIPNGVKISSIVTCKGMALVGILIPVQFTGANLTFYTSQFIDGTFVQIFNKAGAVTYPVSAAEFVAIDPKDFLGVEFLQIRSDSNEGAERDFFVALKGI